MLTCPEASKMPRMASVSPGAARPRGDDLLHKTRILAQDGLFFGIYVVCCESLRRLNAEIALAAMRYLNHLDFKHHLVAPIHEAAKG